MEYLFYYIYAPGQSATSNFTSRENTFSWSSMGNMAQGAHECDDLALTSIFCFQTLEVRVSVYVCVIVYVCVCTCTCACLCAHGAVPRD